MLSNTLSVEDEEAVQSELQALRDEVVRHPNRVLALICVQIAPAAACTRAEGYGSHHQTPISARRSASR